MDHGRFPRIASRMVATIAVAAIFGCSSKSSSDGGEGGGPIATRSMHIGASVEAANDATAKVSARVFTSDPYDGDLLGLFTGVDIALTGGDAFSACIGAQCRPLTREFLGLYYEAELPYTAETTYTISLARGSAADAPNSVVTLPVPFTILAPAPGLDVTDGDRVTVQWSPAGTDVSVWAETGCDHEDGARSAKRQRRLTASVNGGAMVGEVDAILAGMVFLSQARVLRCDIVIEVVHDRRGTIDTALGGGAVVGRVSREVALDYTPRP